MKKLITSILLLAVVFSLFSCISTKSITPTQYESNYDGIYLTIDAVEGEGFEQTLVTTWHNETEYDVVFGYAYSIEYNDGGEWKSCQYRDFAVIEIACVVAAGEIASKDYATECFNLMRSGEYRLTAEFFVHTGEESANPGRLYSYFTVN